MAEADAPMPAEAKAMADRIVKVGGREDGTNNYARVSDGPKRRIDEHSSMALALLRGGPVGLSAGVE